MPPVSLWRMVVSSAYPNKGIVDKAISLDQYFAFTMSKTFIRELILVPCAKYECICFCIPDRHAIRKTCESGVLHLPVNRQALFSLFLNADKSSF